LKWASPDLPHFRQCASTEAKRILRELKLNDALPAPAVHKKSATEQALRVGMVSNGFGQHPTGFLLAELLEYLDPRRLQVTLFATAASDGGPIRNRLLDTVAEIVDISSLSDHLAIKAIREREIDVLIDLRGYGEGGVPSLFALRPATLQVNWLAYPGTTGAPWIDYCFADPHVLPAEIREGFSEKIVYLSGSFQPYDSQSLKGSLHAKSAYQLPDQAVVLASFNNSYKINSQVLDAWIQILHRVPDAVLWLLENQDSVGFAERTLAYAAASGIAPERIIFFAKSPHDQYLAALSHADLFLDTWPYGAHTTARDAQYVGCPLLTIAGNTFAARVGCSLNHIAKMPLLNCADVAHYIESAVALALDPALRSSLRANLTARRAKIFNTQAFADKFTHALEAIDAHARAGLAPQDFDFSSMTFAHNSASRAP
jgi:predicted O-linked N-acetylglucosamine transferase (SPINDLY family)